MPEIKTFGSRAQVMHGNAIKTTGGLTKKHLKYNKYGKIVSRKASAIATKSNKLVKAGYVTTKGLFRINTKGGGNNNMNSPPTLKRQRNNGNNVRNIDPLKALRFNHDTDNNNNNSNNPNSAKNNAVHKSEHDNIITKLQKAINISMSYIIGKKSNRSRSRISKNDHKIDVSDYEKPNNSIYNLSYNDSNKITVNNISTGLPTSEKSNIYKTRRKNTVIKRIKRTIDNRYLDLLNIIVNELRTLIIVYAYSIPNMCQIYSYKIEDTNSNYIISIAMKKYKSDLLVYINDLIHNNNMNRLLIITIINRLYLLLIGINTLHLYGIAHCDIKLDNIFINDDDDNWYLGDFDSSIFMSNHDFTQRIQISEPYRPEDLLNDRGQIIKTFQNEFETNKETLLKSIDIYTIGCVIEQIKLHLKFNNFLDEREMSLIDSIIESFKYNDYKTRGKFTQESLNKMPKFMNRDGLDAAIYILHKIIYK